jgi:hypothetical protein
MSSYAGAARTTLVERGCREPCRGRSWASRGHASHTSHEGSLATLRARGGHGWAVRGRAKPPRRQAVPSRCAGHAGWLPRRRADWPSGCALEGRTQAARAGVAPAPGPRARAEATRPRRSRVYRGHSPAPEPPWPRPPARPRSTRAHATVAGWGPRPRAVRPPGCASHRG